MTVASVACARMVCAPVGRATRERTAASVPAPPTATGAAAVRMGAACVTLVTPAPPAPPVPAWPTAGAVGAVCRECASATRATAARTVGRKSLPPALALGAVGPVNCAALATVYASRASEAPTAPSRHALGTAVAGESVVRAAASAKKAMQGRTAGKVSPRLSQCALSGTGKLSQWEGETLRPRSPGS